MNKRMLMAGTLVFLLAACDNQDARMSRAAENCEQAMRAGSDEIAEELCTIALGDNLGADLEPEIRSQRLYRLGSIKRTRTKYAEAEDLVARSLAIEEKLSGPDSPALGSRLLELALDLAGREQWEEGARYVERALTLSGGFDTAQRTTMTRILEHYAGKLEGLGKSGQAGRFRSAASELESGQAPARTESR